MDEVEFFTLHGNRLCFYILYNIVAFIPFVYLKYTTTEGQEYWNTIYEMLIFTGTLLPFVIEGCYMRKTIKTFTDQRRTIRSFYLAPVMGLISTFLVPHLYFWYVLIGV